MKIIVDELPEKSKDCVFAKLPWYEEYGTIQPIPNCQLKCNAFPVTYGHSFSYTPNRFTCSLEADETCPYLEKQS